MTVVKHIYANPLMPEICPILGLGIYLASHQDHRGGPVFPGGCQDSRFSKLLKEILLSEHGADVLEALGLDMKEVGSHSCRKGLFVFDSNLRKHQILYIGAGCFTTSGSVAAPSVVAVFLRAGWTLGNVKDRYLFLSRAGDEYVGRTVSGHLLTRVSCHFTSTL